MQCSASKRQLLSAQGRVLERSGSTSPWVYVSSVSCASCKDNYILIALCSCPYRALGGVCGRLPRALPWAGSSWAFSPTKAMTLERQLAIYLPPTSLRSLCRSQRSPSASAMTLERQLAIFTAHEPSLAPNACAFVGRLCSYCAHFLPAPLLLTLENRPFSWQKPEKKFEV